MSSAVMERIVEQTEILEWIAIGPVSDALKSGALSKELADPHPLLPVFIAGVISITLAVLFVGSILAWIALRHSGVMTP